MRRTSNTTTTTNNAPNYLKQQNTATRGTTTKGNRRKYNKPRDNNTTDNSEKDIQERQHKTHREIDCSKAVSKYKDRQERKTEAEGK